MENTLIAKGDNINGQNVVIVEPTGKTIYEWLVQLPDGYKEQAIANYESYGERRKINLYNNMPRALRVAFVFDESQQGEMYWDAVIDHYRIGTPLPQLWVEEKKPTGKTIREWLNELPDGYREQALENHEKYYISGSWPQIENIKDALVYAFEWGKTPQNSDYWDEVHKHYWLRTPLPKLWQPETQPEPTQLDRIESKLTEILALLKPKSIDSDLHTID